MNKYDQILKAFLCDGKRVIRRKQIECPRPDGGYYYATNSYILVRIKKDLCSGEYQKHEGQPKFEKVFPQRDTAIELNVGSVLEQIMSHSPVVTLTGDEAVCDECDGRGEVTWTYEDLEGNEHYDDFCCPVCKGCGHLLEKEVSIDELNMSINGMNFKIEHIKTILKCIESLEVKTAKIVHFTRKEPLLIEVQPGVEMLAMPNLSEHKVIEINLN